jgi:hypothetical protein
MNTLQENITVNYDIINHIQRKCRTETTFLGFSLSQPQWNGQVVEDKTNTSCHTYHALNSCGIGNLSHICIRDFLHRPEVSHHDLDHLVEYYYSSPYVFLSPTEVTKALALCNPLCVV